MTYIDQASIAQDWALGLFLLIAGGLGGISGAFSLMLILKVPDRVRLRLAATALVLVLGGISFFIGDQSAGSVSESFAKNVATKYDTVGTIELFPYLSSNKRDIKRIDLADGRAIISGTITIAESGEPTIIDPVYAAAGDSVPVRK